MSNALERAANELADELEMHGIKVYANQLPRIIEWRGVVKKIDYGTDRRACRRTLKKFIKAAETVEFKEKQETLPKQETLL